MKTQFRDYLAAVTTRIHWNLAPQGTQVPYVVLTRVSDVPKYIYNGEISSREARIQVDCYADTHAQAQALQDEIQARISGTRFEQGGVKFEGCFVLNAQDFSEENQAAGTRISRVMQDYQVFYQE